MGVIEGKTASGGACHTVEVDAPKRVVNHPHSAAIQRAVQRAINSHDAMGVCANIGVKKAEAQEKMNDGTTPSEMTMILRDAALAQWLENAVKRDRLQLQVGEVQTGGEGYVSVGVNGVVFTDEQFGALLSSIVASVLTAIDDIAALGEPEYNPDTFGL